MIKNVINVKVQVSLKHCHCSCCFELLWAPGLLPWWSLVRHLLTILQLPSCDVIQIFNAFFCIHVTLDLDQINLNLRL